MSKLHDQARIGVAVAMTIAGSDSSGGAGIQADLKTFAAFGVFGTSAITALTAQNTQGVRAVHDVPPDMVRAQIDAVFNDMPVAAVKIGMVSQIATIEAIVAALDHWRPGHVVVDPVMVATSGAKLVLPQAIDTMRNELLPRASIITPNLPEAAVLLDQNEAVDEAQMQDQAQRLLALGARAVLIKGGHVQGGHGVPRESVDFLVTPEQVLRLAAPRIVTRNTHGTGCTLSSALAANLARGHALNDAARIAKAYVTRAIESAKDRDLGAGHGPLDHFPHMAPFIAPPHSTGES
jgi:hydroxymethylpyrimidine/phosphomethylpyrimidine kinase